MRGVSAKPLDGGPQTLTNVVTPSDTGHQALGETGRDPL
jgi:hypothetical protein